MNILQLEDTVKGLPDDRLMREAQQPTGQIPAYLLVSEVQRRKDMRQRYQSNQQNVESQTVSEKILNGGIGSIRPQNQPIQPTQPTQPTQPVTPLTQMFPKNPVGMAGGGTARPNPYLQWLDTQPLPNNAQLNHPAFAVDALLPWLEANRNPTEEVDALVPWLEEQRRKEAEARYVEYPLENAGPKGVSYYADNPSIGESIRRANQQVDEAMRNAGYEDGFWSGAFNKVADTVGPWGLDLFNSIADTVGPWGLSKVAPFIQDQDNTFMPEGGAETPPQAQPQPAPLPKDNGMDESKAGQRAAADKLTVQGPDYAQDRRDGALADVGKSENPVLDELLALKDDIMPPAPDYSDLAQQQQQMAYNGALMEIAAGIAGNDLAGGMRRATERGLGSLGTAQKIEMAQRQADYENQVAGMERKRQVLTSVAGIESQANYWARELLKQGSLDKRSILETARIAVMQGLSDDPNVSMKSTEERIKYIRDTIIKMAGSMSGLLGVSFSDEEIKSMLDTPESSGTVDHSGFSIGG